MVDIPNIIGILIPFGFRNYENPRNTDIVVNDYKVKTQIQRRAPERGVADCRVADCRVEEKRNM